MANLLTTADVREHVETDLVDAALARLNDDADAQVISRAGPLATETENFIILRPNDYPDGRDRVLSLKRKPDSITSITEQIFDNTPDNLAADDYAIFGAQLERLNDGATPRMYWGHQVTVIYVPEDTTATRKGVIVDLIKLAVAYQGVASEKAGDYQMTAPDYRAEREAILNSLLPNYSFS